MAENLSLIENIEKQLESLASEFEDYTSSHGRYQLQYDALQKIESLSFPTRKDEEWKYTEVRSLLESNYTVNPKMKRSTEQIQEALPDLGIEKANILVFVNGYFSEKNSKIIDKVVTFKHLDTLKSDDEIFTNHIGQIAQAENKVFTIINTILSQHGIFIQIPKNQIVENPILLYFLADGSEEHTFIQPRNFIFCEPNSQATVIELYSSMGKNHTFTNVISEIDLATQAHLDHYKIQLEAATNSQIGSTHVHQSTDSSFSNTTISMSGHIIRNDLDIKLNGENCNTYMNGFYMPFGTTHIDNHTVADHLKPNSYSDEMYKGILDGRGTAVFNGKIFVRKYAQKTNAFQSNKNISLSSQATVNTKPQLEIWADDVKCSHGCTTGTLDEKALFYLRSRGIPEDEARKLLLFAFADDVLTRIKFAPMREFVEKIIHQKLRK